MSFQRQQPFLIPNLHYHYNDDPFSEAIMTDDGVDHYHYHYDDFYQSEHSFICCFLETKEGLNPITRKSTQLLVSPYNITPE